MASRKSFQRLVNNIRTNGITEAVEFTYFGGSNFIVNGHHRTFIAKRLGINSIPVREVPYVKGLEIVEPGKNPGYIKYH